MGGMSAEKGAADPRRLFLPSRMSVMTEPGGSFGEKRRNWTVTVLSEGLSAVITWLTGCGGGVENLTDTFMRDFLSGRKRGTHDDPQQAADYSRSWI